LQAVHREYGCAVSISGGSHADEVVAHQNSDLRLLGVTTVGGIGVVLGPDPLAIGPAERQARELGITLARVIRERRTYPDHEEDHQAIRERMKYLVTRNRDIWGYEYEYWRQRGWI
jgi:hypothetical protein